MDVESVRKRDEWARAAGTRAYSDVARLDYAGTSYQFNKASAQDALADRNWLLSEVDRLNSWLSEARKARDEARNERDTARAEVEKLRANLEREHELHQGVEADFHETAKKLRAELEALRAPMTEAELAAVESFVIATDKLKAYPPGFASAAHVFLADMVRALKTEQAQTAEVKKAFMMAERDHLNMRALVEQCRPVVEAVRKWRACSCAYAACDHLTAVRDAPLPTLPEVTP